MEVLVFEEKGKPQHLEKNLLDQRREPTTNPNPIMVSMMGGGVFVSIYNV